jgi:hypothetical protein
MARPHRRLVGSSGSGFTLALLAAALLLAAIITTPAAAQTGPRPTNGQCAAAFGGTCARCKKTVDGALACAKCRPNSIWDAESSTCACDNDAGYGTVSQPIFDAWAEETRMACIWESRRNCKLEKYSSVAGKCVKCDKYFNAKARGNGECKLPLMGIKDTKLTVINERPDPSPTPPDGLVWSDAWILFNICTNECNGPEKLPAIPSKGLPPGWYRWDQGYKRSVYGTDVTAYLTFCEQGSWTWLDGQGYTCSKPNTVVIEAGNPWANPPWMSVGNSTRTAKRYFSEDEVIPSTNRGRRVKGNEITVEIGGHKFLMRRNIPDLDTAKDMVVKVLS